MNEPMVITIEATAYGWLVRSTFNGKEYSRGTDSTYEEVLAIAGGFMKGQYYGAMEIHRTPITANPMAPEGFLGPKAYLGTPQPKEPLKGHEIL